MVSLHCTVMFDAAFFFFNWTLSYKPINIISIIITPSSLCKIIYHYMKSNLFPIWKAPRSSWVLLEKTTTDKSEETKIKTEKKEWPHTALLSTFAGFISYCMLSTVLTNLIVSVPEQCFLHFPGKTIYFSGQRNILFCSLLGFPFSLLSLLLRCCYWHIAV